MTGDLHKLSREALGRLFPIVIPKPDSDWPSLFEKEKIERTNHVDLSD